MLDIKKKYRLSRINEPENFVSVIPAGFLLRDENGKTLKELGDFYYNVLLILMTQQNMDDIKK